MATADSGLIVKATGSAFSAQRYDLRQVDLVISNYRILLDQTIPFAIGQAKLTDRMKEQISYEVQIRHGSLELLSNIVLVAAPAVAAISTDGGFQVAYQVAKLFNAVVTFRRAWANLQTLLENGKTSEELPKVNLNINIDGVTQGPNSVINVNPLVLLAASASKHTVDRLVAGIDGEKIETVSVDGGRGANTILDAKDEVILGSDLEELPTTVDILGKLYEVNFNTKKGWLITGDGRVPVTWEESIRKDIKALADQPNVAFRVRPIVDHRRFSFENSPVGYHVLKVWIPQGSLLERRRKISVKRSRA